MADEALELAKFSIAFAKENVFPKYLEVVKSLGVIKTGFLGTVKENGALNLYDGKLRLMSPDGKYQDFPNSIAIRTSWPSTSRRGATQVPDAKQWGEGFSMDVIIPRACIRTNTSARINVCDFIEHPAGAGRKLEEFRAKFGRPSQLTLLYHWARPDRTVYNAENAIRLLDDPEITSTETRAKCTPRAARGTGVTERGAARSSTTTPPMPTAWSPTST